MGRRQRSLTGIFVDVIDQHQHIQGRDSAGIVHVVSIPPILPGPVAYRSIVVGDRAGTLAVRNHGPDGVGVIRDCPLLGKKVSANLSINDCDSRFAYFAYCNSYLRKDLQEHRLSPACFFVLAHFLL